MIHFFLIISLISLKVLILFIRAVGKFGPVPHTGNQKFRRKLSLYEAKIRTQQYDVLSEHKKTTFYSIIYIIIKELLVK